MAVIPSRLDRTHLVKTLKFSLFKLHFGLYTGENEVWWFIYLGSGVSSTTIPPPGSPGPATSPQWCRPSRSAWGPDHPQPKSLCWSPAGGRPPSIYKNIQLLLYWVNKLIFLFRIYLSQLARERRQNLNLPGLGAKVSWKYLFHIDKPQLKLKAKAKSKAKALAEVVYIITIRPVPVPVPSPCPSRTKYPQPQP